jgi:hypothetical protein
VTSRGRSRRLRTRACAVLALAGIGLATAGCSEEARGTEDVAPAGGRAAGGQAGFPLHVWMKGNAAPALSKADKVALESVLRRIATFAPPGYERWQEIAADGAAAARAGDVEAVRRACSACHDAHRARYRERDRSRPLPAPP